MRKEYKIGISADESYVYARITTPTITLKLAESFTRDLTELGGSSGIKRCLIDVRGSKSVAGVSGEYQYAYEKAASSGLTSYWKMTVLKDSSDKSHDFLQTVMDNAGWTFRLFDDEGEAVAWLAKAGRPSKDIQCG